MKRFFALMAAAALAGCATPDGDRRIENALKTAPEAADGAIKAIPMPSARLDLSNAPKRIIFASCAQQNEDQTLWSRIASENQDLTLYIGDNVYGDVRSNDPALPELKAAYMRLAQSEPFARVRSAAPMLAVWDDHDYGLNDAGGSYQYKEKSEALFEYVWALDEDDERVGRPGVYGAWMFGGGDQRLQVIMLDTRFFRSDLKKTDDYGAPGKERYLPDTDPAKTMLGEAQWAWLEEELKKPADLRLLVSSVQVIADGHGWEAWKMLPAERQRLYAVIDRTEANGVVVLSGDRHAAALYERDDVIAYPLFEATSSSVNLPASRWREQSGETRVEDGPHRTAGMYYDVNYGVIDIDWQARQARFAVKDDAGGIVFEQLVDIDGLR